MNLKKSDNLNYNLYKCILLSIKKKNPKFINDALKIKYFYNDNLISVANDALLYLLEKDLNNFTIKL
uniref:Uncharacterized protein n=1 Tax=Nucleocytoviricota sp. TaxID=2809609 RepID=A0A9E8G514_9VIRU|nr:hypothetical protein [Nucleocytoviricota sp.]UZT29182.1 hypothetical protein [Nucleocytoviricota sp.]